MIRTIFLSLWGCSVAVGVMFFLLQPPTMTEELADEMLADAKEKRSFHTEPALLVAPIVHDTKINGFIFSRVTMELAEDTLAHSQIPVDYILQDIYSNYLMGNVKYSFPDVKNFDLPSFRSGLLKAAN